MTVETKLAVTAGDVRSFSEANNEPTWFAEQRVASLAKATELPMPTPDKTNITK